MDPSGPDLRRLDKALRTVAIAACALAPLAACSVSPTQMVSFGVNTVSYLATGKSVSDHLLSAAVDRDCSVLRITEGSSICFPRRHLPQGLLALADRPRPAQTPRGGPVDTALPRKTAGGSERAPNRIEDFVTYLVVADFDDVGEALAYRARYRTDLLHVLPDYAYGTRIYRVIAGPVREGGLLRTLETVEREGIAGGWMLRLCPATLLPPPCGASVSRAGPGSEARPGAG